MNRKMILAVVLAVFSTSACVSSMNSPTRLDLWGDLVPVTSAARTIVISPDTKYVNVAGGEIVNFIAGSKSFGWSFDGPSEGYKFDLQKTAPQGALDHSVIAYVEADPKYMGGGH
jgi:hypothetical protein